MSHSENRWLTGGRVYHLLADWLRDQITTGAYPPGSVLPSEMALVDQFRIARSTARRGLAVLEDEGLIVTLPGKGRVVRGDAPDLQATYRYQVIARALREQIRAGAFPAGAPLPSEHALRRRHRASRNTVRHALAELEREGLIVAQHGKGRFVRSAQV
ncbi:winged helix-turn-helix domain-containing protein [Streptosporangium sp. NPDC023615]|uniref:winged helix-turn-helix domain-containing protein n=1 Tax=Streptosporangium sp. NPDC023615 TaxID=3154794 RepID=UPI0034152967